MADFSARLDTNIRLIKQPVKNDIEHHHHFPKISWIAAELFIALVLVCAGLYSTADKLDQYISNDTKYRSFRLDTAQIGLQSYLDYKDSLYNANPDMRKMVLNAEERNRINFERLQKPASWKNEAKELEKAVKGK